MSFIIKSIILADDDADDIELFKDAAKSACPSTKVIVARDGKLLLDSLELLPVPDAIVLDLNMPRIDGKSCLKWIRKNKRFDKATVVILSTSSNVEDINGCLAYGADHYLVKPDNYEKLVEIVNDLCYGKLGRAAAEA